ncbi:MAG TPA: hypothetical protein VFN88_11020 [Caulobacteraceae bacterium]|nr:hypothetical protein [Caulobacteraceae bacterium]
MDIHKPKPWRGFREFLKEYLIIVVGVLTALGAEAVVENLHWRHLAEQHDEDLRAGSKQILGLAVERLAASPCVRGELKRIGAALSQSSGPWTGTNPGPDTAPADYFHSLSMPGRPWPSAPWESAIADGALAHLPRERVSLYAFMFKTAHDIQAPQQDVQLGRTDLAPLAFDRTLSAEERAHFLALVSRIDESEAMADSMARSAIRQAGVRTKDLRPDPSDVKQRMEALKTRVGMNGCIREVDVEAIIKTNIITYRPRALN